MIAFMMYSFSEEPGRARALNRLVRSCSVKGAISAAVISVGVLAPLMVKSLSRAWAA
uniref:Uncharacterized protein n=1 Tax=Anguilla anguilla TaxID=7936 RepID=A0A0E9W0I9_ANGAN